MINKDKSNCKIAVKKGLLHQAYVFHFLRVVPEASNNCKMMDLEDAYIHWQWLPKFTEREAVCFVSSIGDQGVIKCNCRVTASQTAVHARRLVGFAARTATGLASAARITVNLNVIELFIE